MVLAFLALATLAAHGWAIWDGVFLDDHLHLLRLSDDHWSPQALLESTTVKPDAFLDAWWQDKPVEWRYTRPFAMLGAKVVYHLSGGSVKALHGLSILLHWAACAMVYALTFQMTRRMRWSIVAGLLFTVYSHSVYAVAWLASQNSVLQTTLTLGAVLCYVRASRLDLYAAPDRGLRLAIGHTQGVRIGWMTACLVLWVLALLSRENAVILPVITASFELAFGGWRHLWSRWRVYVLMGIIGAAFMYWRLVAMYHPMPDFYVRRYDGPEYIAWWIAKLLHFVTAAVWLSPMTIGPTGRYNPFREVPGDCILMLAILGVMGTGYYLATHRARGWWIWPLWIVLGFLPVVPLMAAPHSGYMPGAGFAIAMVLGAALKDRLQPRSIGRWCTGVATWFLIATTTYIPIYRTMWYSVNAAERYTVASVAALPPPPTARDVFFINLPFVNIYAQLHLGEVLPGWKNALGTEAPARAGFYGEPVLPNAPRCHVLTYCPDLLKMDRPCTLEQLDAHRFRVSIEGRPWFSGALGRFLIEGMRGKRLETGQTVRGDGFEAVILRADQEGVRELEFRFDRPLASPEYSFYVTTQQSGAARVRFWGTPPAIPGEIPPPAGLQDLTEAARRLEGGDPTAASPLFSAARSADPQVASVAEPVLRRVIGTVATALAAPVQELLSAEDDSTPDWRGVEQWWNSSVDADVFRVLWTEPDQFAAFRETRESLFRIRETASHVIRTDLYLTGPPFPSPR